MREMRSEMMSVCRRRVFRPRFSGERMGRNAFFILEDSSTATTRRYRDDGFCASIEGVDVLDDIPVLGKHTNSAVKTASTRNDNSAVDMQTARHSAVDGN